MKTNLSLAIVLLIQLGLAQSSIVTEDLELKNGAIELPGTLSYDTSLKKQPLLIFIQGSGNPDRNGNQVGLGVNANYIKMLRDRMNAVGIAFYSFDKRNVTPSNIPLFKNNFKLL